MSAVPVPIVQIIYNTVRATPDQWHASRQHWTVTIGEALRVLCNADTAIRVTREVNQEQQNTIYTYRDRRTKTIVKVYSRDGRMYYSVFPLPVPDVSSIELPTYDSCIEEDSYPLNEEGLREISYRIAMYFNTSTPYSRGDYQRIEFTDDPDQFPSANIGGVVESFSYSSTDVVVKLRGMRDTLYLPYGDYANHLTSNESFLICTPDRKKCITSTNTVCGIYYRKL